ncbi:hypothetical protein HYC85_016515 [Camellia sinensis]|uniref:non-specific serine/threonine protein kinase n=1 Tax=Camellia sinensis TaxID=4442 RepID=A0A7J7H107_CAMSI|nr:hypothetical protein HYC85_016515 [Camellia sinensis]
MTVYDAAFVNSELSKPTSIFGLRLWVVIGIFVGAIIVLILFLLSLCITSRRRKSPKLLHHHKLDLTPVVSKEIQEIVHDAAPDHRPIAVPEIQIDIGKAEHRVVFSDRPSSGESRATSGNDTASFGGGGSMPEVSHLGWGRWYTLRELEAATNGLSDENVIGEGGYGIVYSGVLADNTRVAVKNLLNNRGGSNWACKTQKPCQVAGLLCGRCLQDACIRVCGQWEFGPVASWDVGEVSPLTWDIRMNIILGMAKGLAYLHEGLEPKVVHRDIKSSNILLDRQWHPKVSDFGLAKLLCSERSYVTTRVMGTFGYVAPEYACTGMLNEKSDIYSFGILIMEIISGRNPVDYSRPKGEVNLVDWLKTMVGNRKSEEVVDPKLPEMPPSKALKRILLVALRCVDPDAQKRPKMGHVIHMLEADDLLFRDERRIGREPLHSHRDHKEDNLTVSKVGDKLFGEGASDTSEGESSRRHDQPTRCR